MRPARKRAYFWSSLLVPVPGLPIGKPFALWPTPAFRSAWAAAGDVPFGVGGWTFGLFRTLLLVLTLAPVVVPCVPIPDGADGPELALLDEVPTPAPELAADPAPPAPPAPPPPPCANAGQDRAMHARAVNAHFPIMDDLLWFGGQSTTDAGGSF